MTDARQNRGHTHGIHGIEKVIIDFRSRLDRALRRSPSYRYQHASTVRSIRLNRPPTAAVKAARIGDPLHAELTVYDANRRSGYPCIQQQQFRQHVSAIRCPHTSRSVVVSFIVLSVHVHD
ncbi:hypothetical protein EVAR_54935_1 [Eumeta japonica]|uniref:Uncharacterized protein n=1 Tax=Eumeta variegata TaxID=151549 RepID=A0A4C1YA22_EUMVA|nr:hypothetical protein EVAR_54935_1 [Eumeta japonica]